MIGSIIRTLPTMLLATWLVAAPGAVLAERFVVIGDLQRTKWIERLFGRESNADAQQTLIAAAARENPDALLIPGDLVSEAASPREWRHFDRLVEHFGAVPVLPALGNHDYYGVGGLWVWSGFLPRPVSRRYPWLEEHGTHYVRRFEHGAVIALDSERDLGPQASWLAALLPQLAREGISAALVLVHRPPWTNSRVVDSNPDVLANVACVIRGAREAPARVVLLTGHAHGYEHFYAGGLHVVVAAGGGGPRQPGRSSDERPFVTDVYRGPMCLETQRGRHVRPLNYVVVDVSDRDVQVRVEGLCRDWLEPRTIETFRVAAVARRACVPTHACAGNPIRDPRQGACKGE